MINRTNKRKTVNTLEGDHIKINHWLTPLSWLYGLGVGIRNVMFDCKMLPSVKFDVPVICVGNITVGGTGKTPHTEYLMRLLSTDHQVAVLSRGYKRKSKGYVLADADTPMEMVGDEPYQIKHKFPDAHVAVDRDRCNGIRNLLGSSVQPPVDVVILDDAYQHRYVTPGLNLLLMDYHRLVCFDKLLPAGRLREHQVNMRRADVVIVTKCPKTIKPMEIRGIERSLGLYTWQKLFFTYFRYGKLYPLFDKSKPELELRDLKDGEKSVMLLTGIASPQQMEYDLEKYTDFVPLHFSDHHDFDYKDLCDIERTFDSLPHGRKIIVTTEKDSVRLMNCRLREDVADSIYVLPVEVAFMNGKKEEFNKIITGYVHKDSRNSSVPQRTDEHKA